MTSMPKTTVTLRPADQNISNAPHKVLFVGQKVAGGTATAGALIENIGNDNSWDTLFGANSMLAGMLRSARLINPVSQFDAIALDDNGSGVAASGSIAFSGTATASGTLIISIGSAINHKYSVGVTSGDTATEVGDALEALINADTKAPFTAANTTGTVAITLDNDGTVGNNIGMRVEGAAAGISVALTDTASGANDVVITSGLFDVLDGERYQTIVWPYTSSTAYDTLLTWLDDRYNVDNDVLDGVAITTKHDSVANLITAANAENSQSLVILGDKLLSDADFKGASMLEISYVKSALIGAYRALKLTEGADLSDFIIANDATNDLRGGIHMASFPYFNTPMSRLPLIPTGKGFSKTEVANLNNAGVSVLGNNKTRTTVLIGELYTTYKTDAAGNVNTTYEFLEAVDTAVAIREYFFNNIKNDFKQSRLTTGDMVINHVMTNKTDFTAALKGYYLDLSGENFVLTVAGEEALNSFVKSIQVAIESQSGTISASMITKGVTQAREIDVVQRISFKP
jgi:phage tail sheath gpL-like